MLLLSFLVGCLVLQLGGASLTDAEIAILRQNDFLIDENTGSWVLNHSGLPDHGFEGGWGNNPNDASVQDHSYEVPKIPTAVAEGEEGCLYLGAVGLAISGAAFFNPYTAFGYNAVEGDCKETFDNCNGHPERSGTYHYHQLPTCLYHSNNDLRDVLLGVAFDGYAIYGPMNSTGTNLTSADLDKCHGHMYNGRYIYRITYDFPYIMSCYRGSLLFDNRPGPGGDGGMGGPPPGGDGRPPPRGKREALEVKKVGLRYMYKRQMITYNCNSVEQTDWQRQTCWAFCENPSTGSYDNCGHGATGTTRPSTGTTRPTTSSGTTDDDISAARCNDVMAVLLTVAVTVAVLSAFV